MGLKSFKFQKVSKVSNSTSHFKFQKFQKQNLISSLIWKFQISNKWDLKWDVQFQPCIKPSGFIVETFYPYMKLFDFLFETFS